MFSSVWDWPEPYMHSIYDRIFGEFPAEETIYTMYIP